MSTKFASAGLTAGQLNAIVKKLGGHDMALRFLRGELLVSEPIRSWREEDGVIYFSVTSNSATGEDWIKRLESMGFCVDEYTKQVLRSLDFKPTSGVTTEVAVLKGALLGRSISLTMKNIRAEADKRKLGNLDAEVACLICEKFADFSNEEIRATGLQWIIAMHEPIRDLDDGTQVVLTVRFGYDGRWLSACGGGQNDMWFHYNEFAFASQVTQH